MTKLYSYDIINIEVKERKIMMINFVLGMFLMWWALAELICFGDKFLKQECNWEVWWIWAICFPAIIIQVPFAILTLIVKIVKKCSRKKSKSK